MSSMGKEDDGRVGGCFRVSTKLLEETIGKKIQDWQVFARTEYASEAWNKV